MDSLKLQDCFRTMLYWSQAAQNELVKGNSLGIESALRVIEGRIEAVRESLTGRQPIEIAEGAPLLLEDEANVGC